MTMVLSNKAIWQEIEAGIGNSHHSQRLQRLVMKDSLFRVYIAVDGLSLCRMLLLEIPETHQGLIEAFNEPQGLIVKTEKNGQEKKGCVTCIIEASVSSTNDVFSVVASDILLSIAGVNLEKAYTETIYLRLEKWKEFFKTRKSDLLCEEQVVGLLGELEFLRILLANGISSALNMWNGPLEAAQDFQSEKVAVEIKTTRSSVPDCVTISSLAQLDIENREHLFMAVYKVEKTGQSGVSLPEMIARVTSFLTPTEQSDFAVKLLCMGYCDESASAYNDKYSFRDSWYYSVKDSFPKIIKKDIPLGIFACKYGLHLDACNSFKTDIDTIINSLEVNYD